MGFFSWKCNGCHESIKAPYDIPEGMGWQNEVVVLEQGGPIIVGVYDGYGRVERDPVAGGVIWDYNEEYGFSDEDPEMWHRRCWEKAGNPPYSGASEYAPDQGFFY
jgi:hypothetical protein